jgi:hypothetical protein
MSIGEILISEATNLLLLIPAVIGLVMLTGWFRDGQHLPTVIGASCSASHGRKFSR